MSFHPNANAISNFMSFHSSYMCERLYPHLLSLGWVWFSFLKSGFLKKWGFQKVQYKTGLFKKAEYLTKTVQKYFFKKLSVWLTLIKVAVWIVNYQKGQCIYKGVYFILYFFIFLFFGCEFGSYLKINYFIILKSIFLFLKKLFFSHQY